MSAYGGKGSYANCIHRQIPTILNDKQINDRSDKMTSDYFLPLNLSKSLVYWGKNAINSDTYWTIEIDFLLLCIRVRAQMKSNVYTV